MDSEALGDIDGLDCIARFDLAIRLLDSLVAEEQFFELYDAETIRQTELIVEWSRLAKEDRNW